jgi:hypothetical protein
MYGKGKRVKVEMGTGLGVRLDNLGIWYGPIIDIDPDKNQCKVRPEQDPGSTGRWVPASSCVLSVSSMAENGPQSSRGKAGAATLKRIQKKLDMDLGVTLRDKDKEIANLKKARKRDKLLSANNLKKRLQEQERALTSEFLREQGARKTAEEGWKIKATNYAKEATRRDRTIESLTQKLDASNEDVLQASVDVKRLRTQHEEVVLELAILKKKTWQCHDGNYRSPPAR